MSKRNPFGAVRRPSARKIHLHSHQFGPHEFASCGAMKYGDDDPMMLLGDEQLVWLPVERQCNKCHAVLARHRDGHGAPDVDYRTCDTHSATPLMLTAVECFVLQLARLGAP